MTTVTIELTEEELAEAEERFGSVEEAVRQAVSTRRRQDALEREFSPDRAAQYATLRDLPR
jgi:predicted  nucleic acid-binding Zn-ribbon protein